MQDQDQIAFDHNREITWSSFVEKPDLKHNKYDLSIGRDLMQDIGLDLIFSENLISGKVQQYL